LSALVSGILSKWTEVSLIVIVISINVAIGIIQEGKAEKAAEALKAMLSPNCTVLREGGRKTIDAAELVPGDVVFLQSGDRVPADVRLFDVSKLQVLESLLTGESHPIPKNTQPVLPKAPLGDRKCMGFSATLIMSGQALGIVVETGDFSEIGQINSLVSGTESGRTNLTVQLEIFGRWISAIVAVIAVATLLLAYFVRGETIGTAFTSAVAVAVAIIPEGLPAVVTIVLAIATQAMARKNAIIKSLPAVETLGSVTVICSDKTGTLTKNEMTAVAVRTAKDHYTVTGVGYEPTGGLTTKDGQKLPSEDIEKLSQLILAGVLCSDADLREPGAVIVAVENVESATASPPSTLWTPVGDPTEVALITLSRKIGIVDTRGKRARIPRVVTVPFESEYKFMATGHAITAETISEFPGQQIGQVVLCIKGAPDRLLSKCKFQATEDNVAQLIPVDEAFWQAEAAALSKKGLRVLALCHATLPLDFNPSDFSASSITDGLTPLTMVCLVAILDPPREEAMSAIAEAHEAGIVVKMITGDHRDTALAIGRMLAIAPEGHIAYTGSELDAMRDTELDKIVMQCNVFARASPENKIRIVKALQRLGHVCSMTGDGVNDAPALKAANIGVAMGITGTDVSKEAAKMVLADDNFATIVIAVREGRRVWDNLVKILTYNTPVNIAQGMTTFFSYAIGLPNPPLTALAILYVNMITSVAMGMAFAFEPQEADIMTRPPRALNSKLFSAEVIWRNVFVGGLMIIAIIGGFELGTIEGLSLAQLRGEAFTQLVFCECAYVFNCRFLRSTSFTPKVFMGNKWIFVSIAITVLLQIVIIYTPGLNSFFYATSIPSSSWGRILGFSALVFVIVEIEKRAMHFIRPILSNIMNGLSRHAPDILTQSTVSTLSTEQSNVKVMDGKSNMNPLYLQSGNKNLEGNAQVCLDNTNHHQSKMDTVRFVATSASSFGIPLQSGIRGIPGEAAKRPISMSTSDMFSAVGSNTVGRVLGAEPEQSLQSINLSTVEASISKQ
jgi:magnesium-transporting ATPase (P-type)